MTAAGRRLPKLPVSHFTPEQRGLYDAIVNGPRGQERSFALTDEGGCLEGPFNAMLLSPRLGTALQALGSEIRFGSALSAREREIAILVVAGAWKSEFERYAHEAVARTLGLTQADFDAVASGRLELLADEREVLVGTTALSLATRADLSDEEYAACLSGLGVRVMFELSTLVGYYATLALQLRIFRVSAPP